MTLPFANQEAMPPRKTRPNGSARPTNSKKPEVRISTDEREVANKALAELVKKETVYQRGGLLVDVVRGRRREAGIVGPMAPASAGSSSHCSASCSVTPRPSVASTRRPTSGKTRMCPCSSSRRSTRASMGRRGDARRSRRASRPASGRRNPGRPRLPRGHPVRA